jgi:hypothetical protein
LKADCANGTEPLQYICTFAKNGTRTTGAVDFAVHLSNELLGKDLEPELRSGGFRMVAGEVRVFRGRRLDQDARRR